MTDSKEAGLIALIEDGFSGVSLEDGISLNMTEYHDSGGCAPEYAKRAEGDERGDWRSIANETIENFTVTFSFTDLKGFRFYIPAYMIWTLRNHGISDSIVADNTIYAIDPEHYLFRDNGFESWFTEKQINAMLQFLEYCIEESDSLDGEVARKNLDKIRNCLTKT